MSARLFLRRGSGPQPKSLITIGHLTSRGLKRSETAVCPKFKSIKNRYRALSLVISITLNWNRPPKSMLSLDQACVTKNLFSFMII